MRYFYAKLGQGNSLAANYLSGASPISSPAIPIFFDCTAPNREALLNGRSGKEQASNFFWCEDHPSDARVIALHQGMLYLTKPAGPVVFWKCDTQIGYAGSGEYVKLLPVNVVKVCRVTDIPAVLSTLTANAYFYSGTFREIKDTGVVRAIQSVAGARITTINSPQELLMCLSSIELETLIAKLFEEGGCFVPAYRGGASIGIDILARNTSARSIEVLGICISPGGATSIQVKRTGIFSAPPAGCDHLVVAERDAVTVLNFVQQTSQTKRWLAESLVWLPADVRRTFKLLPN
jgi:hypothetical protein